ncbi:MAG: hypothetical protein R6V01_00095 [Thermoplasmatota archaeon]
MRLISLMSGGIDSPVATYLMLKRGAEVLVLNMDTRPFGESDEVEKTDQLWEHLQGLFPGRVGLLRARHGLMLSSVNESSNPKYTCVLCKRAMLRTADRLCTRYKAQAILMGDSLGQVASQTLQNLAVVSYGIEHPILRPLIGLDKLDIEGIAKRIGTYDISIKRTVGCLAAPRYPMTSTELDRLKEESEKADMDRVLEKVLSSIQEVKPLR